MRTAKFVALADTASVNGMRAACAIAIARLTNIILVMSSAWEDGADTGARKGEQMSKLYQNKWAGYETYFTPTYPVKTRKQESEAVGGYEIIRVNGKWQCRKGQYYTYSLRDEEHFPVVGDVKINILGYVMGVMLDALERRSDGYREVERREE